GGVAVGGGRAPGDVLCLGRLALGGPLDSCAVTAPRGANPYGPPASAAHLPPRVYAAMGDTLPHQPAHAQPPGAQAGGADGGEGDGRQGTARRGPPANRQQDRRGATLRGGVNQDGGGVGIAAGGRRALRVDGPVTPAGHPDDAAGFADGQARPPGDGAGGGTAGS